MSDKVEQVSGKETIKWTVYGPGRVILARIEATHYHVGEDHILYLSNGPYRIG